MLSDISTIFDPLGLLTPVTLKLKLIMQSCWVRGVDWDEELPSDVQSEFMKWRKTLPVITKLKIPRHTLKKRFELHLFCDASELAYAACIYVRCLDTQETNLLVSKSKVAPLKPLTVPKLELCAAFLGCNLLKAVLPILEKIKFIPEQIHGWTDYTLVLSWLQEIPRSWNTFIANRVQAIQDILKLKHWKHVPSEDNPADLATRGISADQLDSAALWWNGPKWLGSLSIPKQPQTSKTDNERKKSHILCFLRPFSDTQDQDRFNLNEQCTLSKAIQVHCYVRFFIDKLRMKNSGLKKLLFLKKNGPRSLKFRQKVLENIVRWEQGLHFEEEIACLQNERLLPRKSPLLQLHPFIEDGILKVGGRIRNSWTSAETKRFPILIPKESPLSRLIIVDVHLKMLHAGANATLAEIRRNFWIIHAKTLIRKHIHNCIKCFRYNSRIQAPLMGDLPEERITPSPPFTYTSVDFTGAFTVKDFQTKEIFKCYMALFVCFSTKAIHLELVSSLSTPACTAALRRFVARRGAPIRIYSDNGTNFVGTANELKLLEEISSHDYTKESLPNLAVDLGSQWFMIPPGSPHWGGLWESGIKSAKHHLKKTMGNNVLNYEELATLLCDIEAILNSRPLIEASDDPTDDTVLTPSMLVNGKEIRYLSVAEKISPLQICEEEVNPQRRWIFLKRLISLFWKRWSSEYLTTLQTRRKWIREANSNLEEGDVVFVTDETTPPLQWPLGRIVEVYRGKDKICRVVKVRTARGEYVKPAIKLRKLPLSWAVLLLKVGGMNLPINRKL